jgi:uncharacterized protein (DUF924 family)
MWPMYAVVPSSVTWPPPAQSIQLTSRIPCALAIVSSPLNQAEDKMRRMDRSSEVLEFWFGAPGAPGHGEPREAWFKKHPEFDRESADRFAPLWHEARAGAHADWSDQAHRCLALIIVCDQFPRNMFRGDPQAFATDPRALALAHHVVDREYDLPMSAVERLFAYLPFQHSESLEMQRRSVALYEAMPDHPKKAYWLDFAVRHMRVIERFGRFPHRNAILGRASTPEEIAFLKEPGSSF